MKANILMTAAILALAPLATFAQTSQRLNAGKASEYGLVYSLPMTGFDIYLEARLDEEHPGEFYNYARRHLGINNAVTSDAKYPRFDSWYGGLSHDGHQIRSFGFENPIRFSSYRLPPSPVLPYGAAIPYHIR